MDKKHLKTYQIIIDTSLDQRTQKILQRYWAFDGEFFTERIGNIGRTKGLDYTSLLKIIKKHSHACIADYCADCDQKLFLSVKSQTKFLKRFHNANYCLKCQKKREKLLAKEQERLSKYFEERRKQILEHGLEIRAWKQLTPDECQVLLGIVQNPDKVIDFGHLQNLSRRKKLKIIDKFEFLGLITRPVDYGYYQAELGFSQHLVTKLKDHLATYNNLHIKDDEALDAVEIPF